MTIKCNRYGCNHVIGSIQQRNCSHCPHNASPSSTTDPSWTPPSPAYEPPAPAPAPAPAPFESGGGGDFGGGGASGQF